MYCSVAFSLFLCFLFPFIPPKEKVDASRLYFDFLEKLLQLRLLSFVKDESRKGSQVTTITLVVFRLSIYWARITPITFSFFFNFVVTLALIHTQHTMPNPIILEDAFTVDTVNAEGTVYLRVSRIACSNKKGDLTVTTDINSEEFPVIRGERLAIALATTLERSGEPMQESYDHSVYHRETLLQEYDYVMYGKVYECNTDDKTAAKLTVYISFGGLLGKVEGTPETLREVHFNADLFLLVKRVGK